MSDPAALLIELERRMAQAVAAQDYEAAARLRDKIAALSVEAGGSRLRRSVPGAMGLGTSDPAHVPPKGWVRPKRPSPLVGDHRPRGGKRP
ncbi:MAG TPA: UvrB/UvrC motif-containing protein [Caulobacteraceae bacterium]|jgi:hypothetical protein|nr:UvrB/UvrC motif-containing protein [Caulobacteraceae bacterium]